MSAVPSACWPMRNVLFCALSKIILVTSHIFFPSLPPLNHHHHRFSSLVKTVPSPLDDLLFVGCAFTTHSNFCFGDSLAKVFARIRSVYFGSPEQVQLSDHRRALYDHYIRHYQMNLLKTLLINSHVLLEQSHHAQHVQCHVLLNLRTFCSLQMLAKLKELRPGHDSIASKTHDKRLFCPRGQVEADDCSTDDSAPGFPTPPSCGCRCVAGRRSADRPQSDGCENVL
ncbi:hypothetical protein niasHS_003170 [Heterodera schachtii]|uniref:Uncharacterized protein n=1 Tax=Heterodera schachtii TaxID=97005 RepID=A0ABD2KFS5_HETSC